MPRCRTALSLLATCTAAASVIPAQAQETLDRTPGLSGGWVGYAGELYANVPVRFTTSGGDVLTFPTFEVAMGLPMRSLVGVRFAPRSGTVPGRANEWEAFGRVAGQAAAGAEPVDVALGASFNGAARSLDGQASAARWFGPLRLIGEMRVLSRAYGEGLRGGIAGGAVLHPLEGRLPLALTGSVASLLDPEPGDRLAWTAGVQLGVAYTTHTVSLFATNTPTGTLQGLSRGDGRLRAGVEVTMPVPAGRFLGWYVPRAEAARAVAEDAEAPPELRADIFRYLFAPRTLEVPAGTTIEWINRDSVVHTVSADDGAWNSGAIQPGERWRATYDRPGRYPFHCAPHPFMKGVVVVR